MFYFPESTTCYTIIPNKKIVQNTEHIQCKITSCEVIEEAQQQTKQEIQQKYRVSLSVLDPRKCEYLKDYSLDFEHA